MCVVNGIKNVYNKYNRQPNRFHNAELASLKMCGVHFKFKSRWFWLCWTHLSISRCHLSFLAVQMGNFTTWHVLFGFYVNHATVVNVSYHARITVNVWHDDVIITVETVVTSVVVCVQQKLRKSNLILKVQLIGVLFGFDIFNYYNNNILREILLQCFFNKEMIILLIFHRRGLDVRLTLIGLLLWFGNDIIYVKSQILL